MNDIESIIIYGYAGYAILTDFYLLIFGAYQKMHGLGLGFQRHSDAVFFVRKVFGVAAGLALIVVYQSEILGFFWSLVFFLILTVPESVWLIYKDTQVRKHDEVVAAGRVRAHNEDE